MTGITRTKATARLLLAFAILATLAGCQSSGTPDSIESSVYEGRLTFRAKVSDLGLQTGSYAAGKSPGDIVEVVLPGKRNFVPKPTFPVAYKMATRSTLETAATSDFFAFRNDNADWILENFSDADQAEVRGWLANDSIRTANQRYYSSLESMQVWGEAELGGYRLVFVRYNGDKATNTVMTYTSTPQGWKRTNALKDDETFDVVFAGFRNPAPEN
jgi:hypothetical protein